MLIIETLNNVDSIKLSGPGVLTLFDNSGSFSAINHLIYHAL